MITLGIGTPSSISLLTLVGLSPNANVVSADATFITVRERPRTITVQARARTLTVRERARMITVRDRS